MNSTQRTLALKTLLQLVAGSVNTAQSTTKPPRKGPDNARGLVTELRRPKLVQRSA